MNSAGQAVCYIDGLDGLIGSLPSMDGSLRRLPVQHVGHCGAYPFTPITTFIFMNLIRPEF